MRTHCAPHAHLALLFQTGSASNKFVLVLATNRPADIDKAVLDRLDEMIEFPLPGPYPPSPAI